MTDQRPQPTRDQASKHLDTRWAFHLCTVSGIPIRIHVTFLLLLAWLAYAALSGAGPGRLMAVVFVLAVFACVVLHELGHSVVAQAHGVSVHEIVLYPVGGVARLDRTPPAAPELRIALAGPLVNVVIAGSLFLGLQARAALHPLGSLRLGDGMWLQELLVANVLLALFNMLPAFPMDGGRVLRALLVTRLKDEERGTEIAAAIGQVLALAMGFYGFFSGTYMLIFVALLVFMGAAQETAVARGRTMVEGMRARDAMVRDFRTLPVGSTLRDASDVLLETSQQDFPVMNGGEVVGVLSRQDLMRGLAGEGPTGYVAGAMAREYAVLAPDADLRDAAIALQTGAIPVALVMEDGKLLGLVTMENLAELLVLRQILRRRGTPPQ